MLHFGTGGWRAVIGDDFTRANIQLLTAAIIRKLKDDGHADKGFVIGYDRRFLSEVAARWAAEVVAGEGVLCRVINRESPTPLIMFAVNSYKIPYGMAVTASHNPAIYNGIKVFMEGGRDADEKLTAHFEEYIAALTPEDIRCMPYEEALAKGKIVLIDPMNDYLDTILGSLNAKAIRDRRLHVALDPMYGVGRTALETILYTTRCKVNTIHQWHDALFGGRLPAPSEAALSTLIKLVRETSCDIGIAMDGDADRLGVVDDHAEFLHPNKILVLLYYYLLKYKGWRGAAVRNIATTHMLDKVAQSFGEMCYEVPVGFKHVSGKMAETGAIIGGESSGGLTVRGHIHGKDGIFAGALMVEMLGVTGRPLSALWRELEEQYGTHEMAERDHRFTEKRKGQIRKKLLEDKLLPEFDCPVERVSYLDGCKVYFQNGGWIIVRFSGTEPLLRIFCEMPDIRSADAIADAMEQFLGL